ncbi:hypothetical protein BKK79_28370 [Cupriavidus sp. USMAA2-4]|uniref:nitric oxide reductase activation protein NorD n=1 Tax=Cupriavidus sp. USMAA2-4 TaxID=876364 RepID=UPI0008A6BAD7|nr:VWA domain-containing protein [Cupriavidus sp. USMAA2-4]AOY95636.1 hypothetical protein BKK79_28370 [Cupriavidus sp. USMAA2-4]
MLARRVEIVGDATGDEAAPRPTIEDSRLTLPADFWPGPARDTLCRAAAAHALAHWRHSPRAQATGGLTAIGRRVADAIEDARAEALLLRDYPGLRALWAPCHDATESLGLSLDALLARLGRTLFDADYRDGNAWIGKARALFDAQCARLDDYRFFRSLASVLANDLGQMRVRFEPDSGRYLRYRDDGAWLWAPDTETIAGALLESLEDSQGEAGGTASGAASEMPTERGDAQVAAARHTYAEWDYRLAREHPSWTTVLERPPRLGPLDAALDAGVAADRLAGPRRPRARRTAQPAMIRRRHLQDEGDALDIDAAVALRAALRRGLLPDTRVFTAVRPGPRESAVLILLDLSASTDLRVAALEKRAACQLAETLDGSRHRLAIHGFCSDGRHQVFYHRFKDFDAPLDDACRDRLLRARSGLSTRIGAALRHATAQVLRELPRRARILLIGDGEPADIDVFDPRYLPADAAHAVHAARRRGVDILALSFANGTVATGAQARPAAGTAAGGGAGDTMAGRQVYDAATFAAAMARAHAFIAH